LSQVLFKATRFVDKKFLSQVCNGCSALSVTGNGQSKTTSKSFLLSRK